MKIGHVPITMKASKIWIFLFFLFVIRTTCFASSSQIIQLTPHKEYYKIGYFMEVFEDKYKEYSIEQVSSLSFSTLFQKMNSDTLNLGLTSSAIWLRFTIQEKKPFQGASGASNYWILNTGRRNKYDYVDFYIPVLMKNSISDEKNWVNEKAGLLIPKGGKILPYEPLIFNLPPYLESSLTFYLRIEAGGAALWVHPVICSTKAYLKVTNQNHLVNGIYFGIIIIMISFNLHAFLILKDITYLYYVLYVGLVGIWFSLGLGFLVPHLPENSGRLGIELQFILMSLIIIFALLFVRSFLMTKKYSPFYHKILILLMIPSPLLILSVPFASFLLLNQIMSIYSTITIVTIILSGLFCWLRGFRPARFFTLAWSILMTCSMIFTLTFAGILPFTALTYRSFQIGSGLEVLILGFSLLDRIRVLQQERAKILDVFGKYVTHEIRDEVLEGRIPLDGETKEVTVLFSDLRNFTALVDSTHPKEAVHIINNYFSEMASVIQKHHGLVLQFVGDEIEAVFGAPLTVKDHPVHAVKAALEMRQRLIVVNENMRNKGYRPLKHGIGIHTGNAVAANIGSSDRLSYALVGDMVNVASRIEGLTKEFDTDLIISATTKSFLDGNFQVEKLPEVSIKGKKKPIEIFRVI